MNEPDYELIKHREIAFCTLHADHEQAKSAMLLFSDVEGIINLQLTASHRLHVSYDIRLMSLIVLEEALIDLGFHLDGSLLYKLKRALYYYTEEVQRENIGCPKGQCHRNIFINRYQRLQHGCRDDRPEHWRKYL